MSSSNTSQPISRKKLAVVITGAVIMVLLALGYYASSFFAMTEQSRVYEESPDIFIYSENDAYQMSAGDTIEIPIILEINSKNKEVDARVTIFGVAEGIYNESYVKTGQDTLPTGFSGSLNRDAIYVPATLSLDSNDDSGLPDSNLMGERMQERLIFTISASSQISPGLYDFAPTVFTNAIDGSHARISSSFSINIVRN